MQKQIEAGPFPVVCQKWEESESGWGVRPDGYSLHLSMEGLRRYIKDYWDRMPEALPESYERPCGTPYEVEVADEVVAAIREAGDGVRYYGDYQYPGSGGTDGWISRI